MEIDRYMAQIKNETANEETYLSLLKEVYGHNQFQLDAVIGLFKCRVGAGEDFATAFDAVNETVAKILLNKISPPKNEDLSGGLNESLKKAQSCEIAYKSARQKIKEGEARDDELVKALFSEANQAWEALHTAINQSVPVRFRTVEGGVNTIAQTASMTYDRMLYYSSNPDPSIRFCHSGVLMTSVVSLEKV